MPIIKKSLNQVPVRRVDDQMSIAVLFSEPSSAFDSVIGTLKGDHGFFVNSKSEKAYFVLEGSGTVIINEEETSVQAMDFIHIPVGAKHGLRGDIKVMIICSPPFDIKDEIQTND